MRHRTLPAMIALTLAAGMAHADEGMWMPSQLPQLAKQLKAAGFKGDPRGLADLTRANVVSCDAVLRGRLLRCCTSRDGGRNCKCGAQGEGSHHRVSS